MKYKNCQREGCANPATHEVVLELGVNPNHEPAPSSSMLYVCDDHTDVKWQDVVSEKGWHVISEQFTLRGHQALDKRYSRVRTVPLKG